MLLHCNSLVVAFRKLSHQYFVLFFSRRFCRISSLTFRAVWSVNKASKAKCYVVLWFLRILKLKIKRQDKSKNSPLIEMSYDFNFFFSPFVEIFLTFAPKIKSNHSKVRIMTQGLLFWETLICALSLIYVAMPVKWTGKKNEIVSFVGVSISLYFVLRMLLQLTLARYCNNVDFLTDLFFVGLIIWFTAAYLVYPFHEHQRNRQFICISVTFSGVVILFTLIAWLLVSMSSM